MPDSAQLARGRAIQPLTQLYYDLQTTSPRRYDERAFTSGLMSESHEYWTSHPARLLRYSAGWAMYEGTIYRSIHKWAEGLKEHHDLYEAVQALRSPAKRIVDLTASYVYRGPLDLDAGDGTDKERPTSIPIVVDDETLRPIIAQIFRLSVWQANKECYARDCAAKGDVFLQVVDNAVKEQAYIIIRDPATVYDVEKDDQGNIRGYTIIERRVDPDSPVNDYGLATQYATYIEVCTRGENPANPDTITYRTFKDRVSRNEDGTWETYDWDGFGGEWTRNYGFVPMVHVQFKNVGKGFGWNIYQGSFDKLIAIDDVASKINDQIRKLTDPPVAYPGGSPENVKQLAEYDEWNGKYDRESSRMVFVPAECTPSPIVADMDIADATAYLQSLSDELAEDYPILRFGDVSPDASGKARQMERGRVESEVYDIRANLDAGFVSALQMTISIMAQFQYPGPEGLPIKIDVDAYKQNKMGIKIGNRPVFAVSDDDKLDQEKKRSDIFAVLVGKGMPFEWAAKKAGWSDEDVAEMVKAKDAADAETQRREQQAQADAMAAQSTTDDEREVA